MATICSESGFSYKHHPCGRLEREVHLARRVVAAHCTSITALLGTHLGHIVHKI